MSLNTNTPEDKIYSISSSNLVKIPREHEFFQTLGVSPRVLREITIAKQNVPVLGDKNIISIGYNYVSLLNNTIMANNKSILKLSKEIENLMLKDAEAYQEELNEKSEEYKSKVVANDNLREQKTLIEETCKAYEGSREMKEAYKRVAHKFRTVHMIKYVLKSIYADKELYDWVVGDFRIKDKESLIAFVKENPHMEEQFAVDDLVKQLVDSINVIKTQIKLLENHLVEADKLYKVQLEAFYEYTHEDLKEVVGFLREFKHKFLKLGAMEEFLKVDGVSEDLNESISVIISIYSLLSKIGFDTKEKSLEALNDIVQANIEENDTMLSNSFDITMKTAYYILGNGDIEPDQFTEDDLWKMVTFTLMVLFQLQPIKSGVTNLLLLVKGL